MKTFGKGLLAAAACGAVFAATPVFAQSWQLDTQRAARQQETAAAQRLDYQFGEANAYGTRYPNRLPGRIDSYSQFRWSGEEY